MLLFSFWYLASRIFTPSVHAHAGHTPEHCRQLRGCAPSCLTDDVSQKNMSDPFDDPKELRAYYDVRVKELHHFSTAIWAFPSAFAALVAAEYRFLATDRVALVCSAVFNLTLCYAFWKHLYNRECVLTALKKVEERVRKSFGEDYVPKFKATPWYLVPRATTLMEWVVLIVSVLFFLHAVLAPLQTHAAP